MTRDNDRTPLGKGPSWVSGQSGDRRVVMTIPEPNPASWSLPPAELHERTAITGGLRTMHELAVAVAAGGRTVELRGPVSRPVLDALAGAARACPLLPDEARRPTAKDIVVMLEGEPDPFRFARLVLSPARLVLAMLAPSGQFGWPFHSPWRLESPLTVALDGLARPEHLRAIAALDIDLWTHMTPVHELARAVGTPCTFIGNGEPLPPPPSVAKDVPVVYLHANRWRSLAEEVADRMRTPVQAIPQGDHETVMDALARARVLLWPARIEGDGRLPREARARGTVVVGLSSNIYATGLDEASGAVAVEDLEHMPMAVEELLADPGRLETLSQAARRSAAEQVGWPRYVGRVDGALAAIEARPSDPAAGARATFGERLMEMGEERVRAIRRVAQLDAQLADAAARVQVLDRELAGAREALDELGRRLDDAGARRARTPSRGAHAIRARAGRAADILRRLPD
jgi:hypothetical protein